MKIKNNGQNVINISFSYEIKGLVGLTYFLAYVKQLMQINKLLSIIL